MEYSFLFSWLWICGGLWCGNKGFPRVDEFVDSRGGHNCEIKATSERDNLFKFIEKQRSSVIADSDRRKIHESTYRKRAMLGGAKYTKNTRREEYLGREGAKIETEVCIHCKSQLHLPACLGGCDLRLLPVNLEARIEVPPVRCQAAKNNRLFAVRRSPNGAPRAAIQHLVALCVGDCPR